MSRVRTDPNFVRYRKGNPSGITVPAQRAAPQKVPKR